MEISRGYRGEVDILPPEICTKRPQLADDPPPFSVQKRLAVPIRSMGEL